MDPVLELQIKTSKMLAWGFTLTIFHFFGIGSLIALILGLSGRRIIRQSEGKIRGLLIAWWCIIVGALQTVASIPVVLSLIESLMED